MKTEKIGAIVLAGGQGKRMESHVQKQYMTLLGKPLLFYSLEAFEQSSVDLVVLVTGVGETGYAQKEIVERFGCSKVVAVVEGGAERYHSVYEGLKALKQYECGYVLIHDGARPLITEQIIDRAVAGVRIYDACVMGMPVKDTIKIADEAGDIAGTPDRSRLWQVQTPQAFAYPLVLDAYEWMMETSQLQQGITDDAMVVESHGKKSIRLIEGSNENLKVTTPEDLIIAEALLNLRLI